MRAALYCRLSEEDRNKRTEKDDSESIQNQKSMLVRYAVEKQWDIYRIYSDDDYTGSDRNRPEFNKMLADAESGKFDVILCKTQSRFTRELELVEKYIHGLFPVWGVRFISIVDNADTENKGNKKSRQINGLVNEWYLEDMSDNIKSVLTDKRKKGMHIGAFALYGYKKDPNQKGHLIIDEEAAEIVWEVFLLFSKGYGKTAIARSLNEKGIPNPTEYKRLKGLRYRQPKDENSTLWKYYTIADMLNNEIYIGNMVQGKYGSVSYKSKKNRPRPREQWYVVEGTHEPIIERELWDKVQAIIGQHAKPFKGGTLGLFAKKAVCANCGYTMRSSKSHEKYYLKCPTRYVLKKACEGAFISVEKLEETVLLEINALIAQYMDEEYIKKNMDMDSPLLPRKKKLESRIQAYINRKEEYSRALKQLYLDKAKNWMTEEQYLEFTQGFEADKKKMERLIQVSRKELDEVIEKLSDTAHKEQAVDPCRSLEKLDRQMVEELIDFISIGKRDQITGILPIEIHWSF